MMAGPRQSLQTTGNLQEEAPHTIRPSGPAVRIDPMRDEGPLRRRIKQIRRGFPRRAQQSNLHFPIHQVSIRVNQIDSV
jgi:hypothetical protein